MNFNIAFIAFCSAFTVCMIGISLYTNRQISRWNRTIYHAVGMIESKYHHGYCMVLQLGPNRRPIAVLFSPQHKVVAVGEGDNTLHAIVALETNLLYDPPKGEQTSLIIPPIQPKGKYNGKV